MRYKDIVVEGRSFRLTLVTWTSRNIRELAETIAAHHKDVICAVNEVDQLLVSYTRRSDGYRFFRKIDIGKEFVINKEEYMGVGHAGCCGESVAVGQGE